MIDKIAILSRVKDAFKLASDADLARFLAISPATLSNWKSRGSIDYDLVFSKCENINFDWLLTGIGSMQRGRRLAPMAAPPPDPVESQGRDPNDVKMIAVLERNIATLEKLADAKDETIKSKDNEISRLEKSESDKDLRIKQYEDYIVSCKC